MKRIAIPIETKVREFDGKLWLALNLASDGYKVALGHRGDIHYTLDIIQPNIYLQKSAVYDPERLKRLKQFAENGTTVLVLDEEGGVLFSEEYYYSNRLSEEVLDQVDYYLAWGDAVGEIVKRRTQFPNERVITTGNPRFDLLNKELREIYRSGAQQHKREFGSYTLINTKFGIGNNKNPEEFRESMAKRNIPVDEEMIDYQQELLDRFLELIQRLSDAAVDENIVIRPHPSEDFEVYRNEFEDDARVHVRHEGDVRSWIFGSTAVIHNSCTTGIESAMLEVPVFSYRPIRDEEYDSTLPNAVSTTVESEEKLVKILQNRSFDSQYEMNSQQRETLKRFFHNLDTQSTDEICSLIHTIDTRADGSFDEFSSGRKRLERLVKRLPLASQFEEQLSQEKNQKFEELSETELKERIELFGEFLDLNTFYIEQIAPWKDAFWLTVE